MNREIMNGGFKIGDRVECVNGYWLRPGEKGTIINIKGNTCNSISECLVEWDNEFCGGHDGSHLSKIIGKDGCCNFMDFSHLKHIDIKYPSIHITTDGKTTTGIMKQGKEVIKKVEAKLYPKDEFNFEEGIEIVMARLFEKEEVVKEKPHLIATFGSRKNYGVIGEEAGIVDIFGEKLFVGDVVSLYKYGECYGDNFVCKYGQYGQYGVMSAMSISFTRPESVDGWVIKKVKSYKELIDGQTIGGLRVVL